MGTLADETRWMDATEQAALVARGEVTASELVEAAIERIERLDTQINAVVIRWFDEARETAAAAPPLDPPVERDRSHGLRDGPHASGSVVGRLPSSGLFVRPSVTRPAARKRATSVESLGDGSAASFSALLPADSV